MSDSNSQGQPGSTPEQSEQEIIEEKEVENPVLARLIEEVRSEGAKGQASYDRVHNRHNR